MPRRREVPKRDILPDPKFGNIEVSKFVNTIMMSGKKSVAERIVYGAFDLIVAKGGKDPIEVFGLAMNNVKPLVEVKSRRVGGANYQVPVEVRPSRRMALAMRWLREAARKRSEKSMGQRLAAEMLEASENRGGCRPGFRCSRIPVLPECSRWGLPESERRRPGAGPHPQR